MFYLDLFRTLQEELVDYVVVGGLAINLHGVERATMDVDLVLAMDEGNLRRFLSAATRLNANSDSPNRPVWLITVGCSVAKTGEAVSDTVRTRPVKKLCAVILCGADAKYGAGPPHVRLDERDLETGLQGGYVGPVKRMRRQQTTRTYGLRATSRYRLVNGYGRVIDGTDI